MKKLAIKKRTLFSFKDQKKKSNSEGTRPTSEGQDPTSTTVTFTIFY